MNNDEAAVFALALTALAGEGRRAERALVKRARTGHATQRLRARRIYHQLIPAGVAHTPWNIELVERVASLFVLNPNSISSDQGLGRALRALADHTSTRSAEAVERRFSVLLTAGPDTLDTHLTRFFARLDGAGIPVDYARLTRELQNADHPDRFVQRRWADEYWGGSPRDALDSQPTIGANP